MSDHLTHIRTAATNLGEAQTADVLLFNGDISRNVQQKFVATVTKRRRRPNVILVLVTPGGDIDAAYRIGRCLQKHYGVVTVFVTGQCKGSGTLVAIAANKLVFSEFGELGPLNVQLDKRDHSLEVGSNLDAALVKLQLSSWTAFKEAALAIEEASDGRMTFKMAAELSCELTTRLFGNLYSQIDPIRIGEKSRAMVVAREYGERLSGESWNLQVPGSLEQLVSSYASHGFVIDFEEAQGIFKNVIESKDGFGELMEALGDVGLFPISSTEQDDFMLAYLNREVAGESSQMERPETSNFSAKTDHAHPTGGPAENGDRPVFT